MPTFLRQNIEAAVPSHDSNDTFQDVSQIFSGCAPLHSLTFKQQTAAGDANYTLKLMQHFFKLVALALNHAGHVNLTISFSKTGTGL